MWISAEHRGKGFGKKLVLYLEKMAQQENHKQIGIGVGLYKDYGRAQKLYVHLGYVPDGQVLFDSLPKEFDPPDYIEGSGMFPPFAIEFKISFQAVAKICRKN